MVLESGRAAKMEGLMWRREGRRKDRRGSKGQGKTSAWQFSINYWDNFYRNILCIGTCGTGTYLRYV